MVKRESSLLNLHSYEDDSDSGDEKKSPKKKQKTILLPTTATKGPVLAIKKSNVKRAGSLSLVPVRYGSDSESDTEDPPPIIGDGIEVAEIPGESQPQDEVHDLPVYHATGDLRDMRLLPPEPFTDIQRGILDRVRAIETATRTSKKTFNQSLQETKDFHNPYILTHLARKHGIVELGTNYPIDVYNPQELTPDDLYLAIADKQRMDEDRKAEEKKKRTSIQFVQKPPTPGSAVGTGVAIPPAPTNILYDNATEAQIQAAKAKAKAAVSTMAETTTDAIQAARTKAKAVADQVQGQVH